MTPRILPDSVTLTEPDSGARGPIRYGEMHSFDCSVEKTIYPANVNQAAATALLNVLRTAFALRDIQLNEKNAFVIRDTAENVAMAEKIIEILGTEAKP